VAARCGTRPRPGRESVDVTLTIYCFCEYCKACFHGFITRVFLRNFVRAKDNGCNYNDKQPSPGKYVCINCLVQSLIFGLQEIACIICHKVLESH
jgi:hypothetical protein